MKAVHLATLFVSLLCGFASGQYDGQPLFVQLIDRDGQPKNSRFASYRRIVYPEYQGAFPFVDLELDSNIIRARGFVADTLKFTLIGPYVKYDRADSLTVFGRYNYGRKHSKWYTVRGLDTIMIRTFYLDSLRLCICLNRESMVLHESSLDHSPSKAFPINLDEVRRAIDYPAKAKEKNKQGRVSIRIFVDTMGVGSQHTVVQTPDPILSEVILKQIISLKFEPAFDHGTKISSWITIPFEFRLLN